MTIAAGFFLFRYRAANCLLGFTAIGLGPELLFQSFSYAQLTVVLETIALLVGIFRMMQNGKIKSLFYFLQQGTTFYAVVLAGIWLKIFFDCFIYGLDDYRMDSLKIAVYTVFLPSGILLFSMAMDGIDAAVKGMIVGFCVFPIAHLLPLIYPMIIEDRIAEAIFGESRLTTYALDTINGGRMFFFGSLGFMLAGSTVFFKNRLKLAFLATALVFFILVLLNGTRQYAGAILAAYVAVLLVLGQTRQGIVAGMLLSLTILAYALRGFYSEAQVTDRVSGENLSIEVSEGRGRIWSEAFAETVQSPLLGVGFRNFGEELSTLSPETGEVYFSRNTAHGFFQEVFVEHGVGFGLTLLLAWLWVVWQAVRRRTAPDYVTRVVAIVALLALAVPETLSAAVFNAFAFHMLAVGSLGTQQEASRVLRLQTA